VDRATYGRYLAAFNARDYDAVLNFYAERFELSFLGYVFRTREEVKQFYAFLHAHVAEHITVTAFVSGEHMVALEADVRLEGIADLTPERMAAAGFAKLAPLKRGQIVTIPQLIHYHLEGGKIIRAICAVFEAP
jgi:hypothetical protein